MRELAEMAWIGKDDVFDLSNTVTLGGSPDGSGDIDFFTDVGLTATWRIRTQARDLATLRLDTLIALRSLVRAALDAADREIRLPKPVRESLNNLSVGAPVVLTLDAHGHLVTTDTAADAQGRIARKVLQLFVQSQASVVVRRCLAPSCGMFFQPRRTDQAWCTTRCGTRARAARYREARAATT
ncbi:hypothetical protein GCM10022198_23100 [Klugiella xanthotipulae]|uniref:Putative stress-induced transcription regulator n=2 Tax=Klugiella xanthotipulae TaxID=244735 RepID=A0A543I5T2_9MICO|nr:putative stress-induced transcription regulator [Klugiella xanthotipulae]